MIISKKTELYTVRVKLTSILIVKESVKNSPVLAMYLQYAFFFCFVLFCFFKLLFILKDTFSCLE